jgi:V/A-type H+-transporting ATPase subunit C
MRAVISPYEALTAKIRAMYGKRLRFEDFERMGRCTDERQVLDDLRRAPGWAPAVANLEPSEDSYVGRVELETALRGQLLREYRALLYFVPQRDRPIMNFPVLIAERDAILRAMRRLKAGADYHGMPYPLSFLQHSALDDHALEICQDYDGIVAAAERTIYAPVLRHLRPESGGLPDYMAAESLLRTAYFTQMYRTAAHQYAGETKALLLRAFGEQTDLLNLIHILRIKTYFPGTEDLFALLFPFNYRLKPDFLRALCAAPDAAAAFDLARRSPYGDTFRNVDVTEVEEYYRRAFYLFNRRQLLTGAPSIYSALSYLNLKETEMRELINVIESVKYGVPYDENFARLISA